MDNMCSAHHAVLYIAATNKMSFLNTHITEYDGGMQLLRQHLKFCTLKGIEALHAGRPCAMLRRVWIVQIATQVLSKAVA